MKLKLYSPEPFGLRGSATSKSSREHMALSRLGVKLRGAQRPDQRKHRLLHHNRHAQASNGSIRRLVALSHHLRWDPRELELDIEPPPLLHPSVFPPARPLISGWGIMRSSASLPYTPWGAMCKNVCHLGGDKEVVAALRSIAAASGQSM